MGITSLPRMHWKSVLLRRQQMPKAGCVVFVDGNYPMLVND
jgi:hypothetical protein